MDALAMFSPQDLLELEALRLARFEDCFAHLLLPGSCLSIGSYNDLVIHCPTPQAVDAMLAVTAELKHFAWLILAVESVAIDFAEECIWEAVTREISVECRSGKRKSTGSSPMTTTTLEQPVESSPAPTEEAVCTVEQLVEVMHYHTGRAPNAIRHSIEQFSPRILRFGDLRLIPVSLINPLMQRWSEAMAAEVMAALHAAPAAKPAAKAMAKTAASKAAAKPKAKAASTKAKATPKSPAQPKVQPPSSAPIN
jgi:hypothetical protein